MDNEPTNNQATETDLSLTVSDDKLEVSLETSAEYLSAHEIISEIQELAKTKGILVDIDTDCLRAAIDEARQNNTGIDRLVIARGRPPEQPRDASLEWARDFFSEGYQRTSESDTIDFHEMAAQPYIEKDELIVKIIAELPGVEGTDVYGNPIKVPPPKKAELRKGPNVYWDEDEQSYRATIPGRIKMTGGVLDVDEVYTIKGDVGPETGNVKHPGAVVVSGDVVSEFKIEAGGSIEIRGQVYASDISCQGDLNVKYGINTAINKDIHVGGTVKSKHISNAHILCHGDVCADAEICNSNLNVRGEVICRGRIVGGSTVSLKGIRAGQAGSETDIKTILVAGVDFQLVDAMKEKKEELENLTGELEKNQHVYKQLKMLGDKLLKGQAEQLREIGASVEQLQERIASLKAEKGEIYQKMTEGRTARIIIDKKIYPRTVLRIFSSTMEVDEFMPGPLVASLDMETNSVVLNPGR